MAESQTPTGNGPAEQSGNGSRPRVLIADDNADMRRHLARLLDSAYEVYTVGDGRSALEAALANPPHLILTDVMMPHLDGFGLLGALRENKSTRTIPVIMLSARAGQEASVGAMQAGVDDYLAKPFSAQELLSRVSRSLELARLRRESEQELEAANRELERALSQLEVLAITDTLTGLPNRRKWQEELQRELVGAARRGQPLSVAMLDLDGLKAYNDTRGHPAGDALLTDAAAAWRVALRLGDLISRIGGDEFAVLMPNCALDDARRVLTRVCAATPAAQTTSAGIACWDGSETAADLVARADEALYVVKRARPGRDAVPVSAETGRPTDARSFGQPV